jgi:hypothetical protein
VLGFGKVDRLWSGRRSFFRRGLFCFGSHQQ